MFNEIGRCAEMCLEAASKYGEVRLHTLVLFAIRSEPIDAESFPRLPWPNITFSFWT